MTLDQQSDRISVAYLIDNLGHGGGTENYLHTLVSHLDASQYDAIIIALGPRWPDFNVSAPCDIIHLGWSRLLHWRSVRPFLRLVRILRERRVRILQLFYPNSRLIGVLAALCARVPRIVISRRDCHLRPSLLHRMIFLITSQQADYCLTNSQAAKEVVLKQERFKSAQITVIPNSIVDINRNLMNHSGSNDCSMLIVGMVANLRPVKRIDRFLRLASRISEEVDTFRIVGYGTEDDRQIYLRYAEELGITDKLIIAHTLTDVSSIIPTFCVGVLTSEAEGLSNALVEYAAAGLPAVAFDVGGNREVIRHGITGFLAPPGREDIMCYYVRLLIHSPTLRCRMGNQARAHAVADYSIGVMVQRTEAFYRRVIQK